LAPAPNGNGGTWSTDGVIVFAPAVTSPVMRVSATGGTVTALTTLGPPEAFYREPYFLPDGRHFLFHMSGPPDATGIYLGTLDEGAATRLTPADNGGVFRQSGWLLCVRSGTLVARRLYVAQGALTGEPITLAEGVAVDVFRSAVSVAATGLMAYRAGVRGQRQLTWIDRSGT